MTSKGQTAGEPVRARGAMLEAWLHGRHLAIEYVAIMREAVDRFRGGADFADALLALRNRVVGCEITLTVDRDAAQPSGFRLLTSGGLSEIR